MLSLGKSASLLHTFSEVTGGFEVIYLLENLPLLPREYGITGNWWIYSGWVGELVWEIGVKEREDSVGEGSKREK